MIRKHKNFARPRKAFEITRMRAENEMAGKYGLKSKREIWKTIAKINYFRHRAMELAKADSEEQKVLFGKLNALGLKVDSVSDVLALNIENLLNRRLQTIVTQKKLANTAKHARQMIAHKRILIDGSVVSVPSYIVSVAEEGKITVRPSVKKESKKSEEAKAE